RVPDGVGPEVALPAAHTHAGFTPEDPWVPGLARRSAEHSSAVYSRGPQSRNVARRTDNEVNTKRPSRNVILDQLTVAQRNRSLVLGAVSQVRRQPLLRLVDRPALAPGIVLDLVAAHPAQHEVLRLRVREVQAAHGPAR